MYQINENIVAREIHGSFFLIDISDNYSGDRCALYEINQTGMFLWKNLTDKKTSEELTTLLKAAIIDDVDYQVVYSDVVAFLNTLEEKNFISEVN